MRATRALGHRRDDPHAAEIRDRNHRRRGVAAVLAWRDGDLDDLAVDRRPHAGQRLLLLGVHAEQPQAARHIVLRRTRLLQRRGRDCQLGLGDQHLLLRDGAIGEQIARPAGIGLGLRERGLALPDVGLSLAPRRLQLGDVRRLDRQQHLAFAHAIAERDADLRARGRGPARPAAPAASGTGFDLAGHLEFIDRQDGTRSPGATRMRSSCGDAGSKRTTLPERVGLVAAVEAGGSLP